ncbi:MAG TPA: hypothetical protein ENG94_00970, partial [Actinobacteria bacterium]|nr:hypothetical protein [Actinomycetota bacterium]
MVRITLLVAFATVTAACTAPARLPPPTTTTTTVPPPSTTVVAPPRLVVPARPFPQHIDYSTPHITPSATSIDADTRRFY